MQIFIDEIKKLKNYTLLLCLNVHTIMFITHLI